MDSIIKEVYSDFKNSLSKIDFNSYNPNSPEFISALNIGLMWYILKEMGEDKVEKMMPMGESEKADKTDIEDELYGAKKNFQKFLDSGDVTYKNMAEDELRHAEILIKKANSKLPTGEEKSRLKEYEIELKQITEQMNQ